MRFVGYILWTAVVAGACQPIERRRAADTSDSTPPALATDTAVPTPAAAPSAPLASKVVSVEGFLTPESVLHDTTQDIYFVSNISGSPTAKDRNGFISRVRPDEAVENLKFIEGGRNGVTLHAPKGLALEGASRSVARIVETLWEL